MATGQDLCQCSFMAENPLLNMGVVTGDRSDNTYLLSSRGKLNGGVTNVKKKYQFPVMDVIGLLVREDKQLCQYI